MDKAVRFVLCWLLLIQPELLNGCFRRSSAIDNGIMIKLKHRP
jgi:hypothetical protein